MKYRVEIYEAVRGLEHTLIHVLLFNTLDEALTRARSTTLANTLPLVPDWYSFSKGPYVQTESSTI